MIKAPKPDPHLYEFNEASLSVDDKAVGLSAKQLLLKGSKLKNTDWVIGAVVYTGEDTKIMRNADKSKFKMSNIERTVNSLILQIILLECTFSLVNFLFTWHWME